MGHDHPLDIEGCFGPIPKPVVPPAMLRACRLKKARATVEYVLGVFLWDPDPMRAPEREGPTIMDILDRLGSDLAPILIDEIATLARLSRGPRKREVDKLIETLPDRMATSYQ